MTSLASNDSDVFVEGKCCRLYLDQTVLLANSPSFAEWRIAASSLIMRAAPRHR